MSRLLFVSNLFPDTAEPYRGLDNAVLLRYLRTHYSGGIGALGLRPTLDARKWGISTAWQARADDLAAELDPVYLGVPYVPKLGSQFNHRLMARYLGPALAELRERRAFDAILCSWLFPDGAALAGLAGKGGARPFVLICQGSDAHQYLKVPARKELILKAVEASGGVVTRSRDLARLLGEAGAAPEKLHPIYNGVDQRLFYPLDAGARTALRGAMGLGTSDPVTLFVGNFLPVKNPRLLLEAFAEASRRFSAESRAGVPRLLMVGGGPMEAEVRGWIAELRLGDRARLEGRQDAAGVARRMQAADVLCMSSENEGVPNVVLEAQATGVPVVATDVGGIGEIIAGAEQGSLSPRGQVAGLAQGLLQNWRMQMDETTAEARRYRIAERGREYAWEKTALQYYELLQKL
jgi:teichuronic acid biosynthesis glycosyltransferase TuaC